MFKRRLLVVWSENENILVRSGRVLWIVVKWDGYMKWIDEKGMVDY